MDYDSCTDIDVRYDGRYPSLCMGTLDVYVYGKWWTFPKYSLKSGGDVWLDDNGEEHIKSGVWSISEWPDGFPKNSDIRDAVLKAVNLKIEHGCCGGCL